MNGREPIFQLDMHTLDELEDCLHKADALVQIAATYDFDEQTCTHVQTYMAALRDYMEKALMICNAMSKRSHAEDDSAT